MPEVIEPVGIETEILDLIQVQISKGKDFFQVTLVYQDGRIRRLVTDRFDMADRQKRRGIIMGLMETISYCIQKKIFPEDTRVYSEPVQTETGWKQNVLGWPEEVK